MEPLNCLMLQSGLLGLCVAWTLAVGGVLPCMFIPFFELQSDFFVSIGHSSI